MMVIMSRKSIYKQYTPILTPNYKSNNSAFWFIFKSNEMLVKIDDSIKIHHQKIGELNIPLVRMIHLGTLKGDPCYSAEIDPEFDVPKEMGFKDLRSLYNVLDEDVYLLAGKAAQIMEWDKNHRFCGKCGNPTMLMDNELAKICPECGLVSYTRISPAVITAIVKDGELLMAQHARSPRTMYGLIAGFVEVGETLKEGVEREIMEEVGLKVKNIKYFKSQPWPFPDSLMIGFTAEYESGEIKIDEHEITDAKWFKVDEVPRLPSKISIASELIDWYIEKYSKKNMKNL